MGKNKILYPAHDSGVFETNAGGGRFGFSSHDQRRPGFSAKLYISRYKYSVLVPGTCTWNLYDTLISTTPVHYNILSTSMTYQIYVENSLWVFVTTLLVSSGVNEQLVVLHMGNLLYFTLVTVAKSNDETPHLADTSQHCCIRRRRILDHIHGIAHTLALIPVQSYSFWCLHIVVSASSPYLVTHNDAHYVYRPKPCYYGDSVGPDQHCLYQVLGKG
jgi:hypothetical protein